MTIYISCMLQISSQKKKLKKTSRIEREKTRGCINYMWIPLQVLTSSSHNFSYASPWQCNNVKHSDISEYSIWCRVIQYYPPGIQQMIYPSKAHAENPIDSDTLSDSFQTSYSNIVLNFAFQYICQRLGFFFFPLQMKCSNQNINSL